MSRWWNQLVAGIADVTPFGIYGMIAALFLLASVVALLWYTWPPRWFSGRGRRDGKEGGRTRRGLRWPRLRWPKLRWRRWTWRWWRWRRRRKAPVDLDELAPDELPDLPADVLALTADQLAAAGRYAEAVRERLRAMVRELIEREVIEHRPGWTVTELATAAGRSRPATAPPLRGAADVFSEIWYGLRPATLDDDASMRRHAAAVTQELS